MRRHGLIALLALAIAFDAASAGATGPHSTGIKVPPTTHPTTPTPPVVTHHPRPTPPRPPIFVPTPPRPVTPPVVAPRPPVVPSPNIPIVVPPVLVPPIPSIPTPIIDVRVPAEVMPPIPRAPTAPLPVGLPGTDKTDLAPDPTLAAPAQTPAPFRPGAPSSALAGAAVRDFVANRVLVAIPITRSAEPGRNSTDVADDYGLSVDDETSLPSLGVRLVTFTVVRPRSLGDLLDQMGLDARLQSAQPVFRYRINASPMASLAAAPLPGIYPAQNMRLPSARLMASGTGVVVALIDTHVAQLPSLRGHVVERVALVPGGDGLHGTALAGLIASVAPDARLVAIEAFDERTGDANGGAEATTLTLARAIDVALNRKADVINLSIAGPRDPLIGRMVRHALSQDVIVVAAAGNDGPTAPPRYPAAYDGVIAVTATDSRDQLYPLGARGPHVAIAAPGVDVPVELPDAMVGYFSGTSIAAAEIAGVAALLRERAPRLASAEARRLLKETATPMPSGPGLVDAFAALSRVSPLAQK